MSPKVDVVLTGVQSLTHVVYASSYLRHQLEADLSLDGVRLIIVPTAEGQARFSEGDLRPLLPSDQRLTVVVVDREASWWCGLEAHVVLLSIGAPGTRALATLLRVRRGRKPVIVVVDEGIGSYGNWRSRRAAYLRRPGGNEPRATLRALAVAGANAVLPDVRWSLYQRQGRSWRVCEAVANEFRLHLDDQAVDVPTAIYLTQPWVELGVMTQADHERHVVDLRAACEKAGLRFGIRPHPLDDPSRYVDQWVLSERSAAEFDRRIATAALVIGANSTALLNIRAIHGTRVLRVFAPGASVLDRTLSRRQLSLLDAILPPAVDVGRVRETLALE